MVIVNEDKKKKLNFKEARKYMNVRYGFIKTKIAMALFMMAMMICLALAAVDIFPGFGDMHDEESIPMFIFALVFIVAAFMF